MKQIEGQYQATHFNRDEDGRFVVSTEATPGSYLTPTKNRQHLIDNPWLAEKLYGEIFDKIRDKANKTLEKK